MNHQFALIGYPIKHSLSPWIHKEFLNKAGIDGTYKLHEIDPAAVFGDEIRALREQDIQGFNVTVPYKQKIIPFLDELDRSAERIGAVNTVCSRNGKWIGYNTDGAGYLRSLEHYYPRLAADKNISIAVTGAGGAARGIYGALAMHGFRHIDIANRTVQSAESIAVLKDRTTNTNVLSLNELEQNAGAYDLIVQTTSVGMKPRSSEMIFSPDNIKSGCVVSDIVYQPIRTAFLKKAASMGADIHFGHTMLLYQAQYAFEIWTGKKIEIGNMESQLRQILKDD